MAIVIRWFSSLYREQGIVGSCLFSGPDFPDSPDFNGPLCLSFPPAQVTVTFHDVAACFEEEDWELMEQWQQDLYRDAMKEIHSALHNLGYRILNPYLLVKIEKHRERFRNNHSQSTRYPYYGGVRDVARWRQFDVTSVTHWDGSPNLTKHRHLVEDHCRWFC
ncbi:zinc finger protein 90-like isoform X3 [Lithobates pipiens]